MIKETLRRVVSSCIGLIKQTLRRVVSWVDFGSGLILGGRLVLRTSLVVLVRGAGASDLH